ncbi:MAG: hypothetical protein ACRENP_14690 [Longimicrobiales bacterium]
MKRQAFLVLVFLSGLDTATAQTPVIEIQLKNDSQTERAARAQMVAIFAKYDLKPYVFTHRILIEDGIIPHSHPILTLSTGYHDRELEALATFLHEQMHWRVDEERDPKAKAAIAEFQSLFPDAPDRSGGGARDRFSTYLHLVVCDLELQSMTRLVGAERARETLRAANHYRWIYDRVLNDARIREVNRRHGFIL